MGVATFWRILEEHGSAAAALAALPAIARAAGVDGYEPASRRSAEDELAAGKRAGARLVARGAPGYPDRLAALADAPPLLWVRGEVAHLARPAVALVGARNASSLGLRMTRHLASALSEAGFLIVSGLARGIDAEAHRASLQGGTVAVMAGGADVIYPAENAPLAASVAASGALVSEHPFGLEPFARHFPMRNRLISGLSQAVVVVEAALQSGSLITARIALDQGREVMAVPGHPFDGRASGCNLLIRDGARLVRTAADVIEALPAIAAAAPVAAAQKVRPYPPPAPSRSLPETAALQRLILDRLGPSPVAEDQLIRDLDVPAAAVAPELLALELDGRIARQPGGLLALVN